MERQMELETKSKVAKLTLWALIVVVCLFFVGVLLLVLCAGLQINPFKETTTSFLIAAFTGLIGIAAVLVLLNVATNISLIADSKMAEMKIEAHGSSLRPWLAGAFVIVVALVVIVLGGTWLSKERYLHVVREQADEVLAQNKNLLNEASRLFASAKPQDYKRIYDIRSFLENQRSGFPRLTLLYSGKFADKTALYQVNEYFPGDPDKNSFTPVYYPCMRTLDCDYLKKFFSGEKVDAMQKYTVRDDEFYIYIPYVGKETRFILLFDRRNSYGKLGS
jgi:hypothetical protein